jgi:hypothetical protein
MLTFMQPTPPRRDWTLPVVLGAVLLAMVLLVLCVAGGAAAFFALRGRADAPPVATASPSVSPSPSKTPAPPPPSVSPADCLIGNWRETSYTSTANLFGVRVQISGSGTLMRINGNGTLNTVDKVTRRGTAGGDRYEVIHNGATTLNYQADDSTIHYSNPRATGTTTWKVNGRTQDTEPMKATLGSDSYTCKGNELRLYNDSDGYTIEWQRVLPPGQPV